MSQQPVVPLNVSGGAQLSNLFDHRRLLQLYRRKEEEEAYFVDYIPPARDAITLPRNVVYVLVGVVLIIVATYAIVGHLIKDLMHDIADWIFGPKPVEEDPENGSTDMEEERWFSVSSRLTEFGEGLRMAKEKDVLLPGFYQVDGGRHQPSIPPPLRSAVTSSYAREKRTSTHSVTFASPVAPFVTSV